jgi:hypothetical protein
LAAQLKPLHKGPEAESLKHLTAVDGSLVPALPKMAWALWNYLDKKAARLHLHFEVMKAAPVKAEITNGKSCEKKTMHRMLEAGRLYVIDRGYEQFRLFQDIIDIESSFICAVRDQMTCKILRERPLSEAARAAGVVFRRGSRLGRQSGNPSLLGADRQLADQLVGRRGLLQQPPSSVGTSWTYLSRY